MAVEFQTYKPGRRIRIQITSATVCEGQDVAPGDVITAAQDDALTLIGANKAFALDKGDPGYRQPATGPDSPPVPDGTYGHQRPQAPVADGTDGERTAEGHYADGSIKPKPADSMGAHPEVKTFYHDAPKLTPGKATTKAAPVPAPVPNPTPVK